MLEEEVYGTNSPIWDPDFSQNAANVAGSPPTTRKLRCPCLSYKFLHIDIHIYMCTDSIMFKV